MSSPETMTVAGASLSIWREAPSLDGKRTAALGSFACETAETGAALIREAMERLRDEGFGAVLGPMDGSTWGRHRLVVDGDGRPPFLMEPSNPAHFVESFEQSGLTIVSRYLSADRPSAVAPSGSPPPPGVTLRNLDLARAEDELTRIHALSLESFSSNAFYQPIGLEDFLESYRPVLGFVDADLVFLAENEDGELQGFLFAVPNFAEGGAPHSVILKTYASRVKGGGSMLANAFHARAQAKGFERVIHALMHESNLSARHSGNTGGKVFRRYALWGGSL
jgi:L-amino acid N-acyltransferase YncA